MRARREANAAREELRVERERVAALTRELSELELVRSAVRSMPLGLVIVDPAGTEVVRTSSAVDLLGEVLLEEATESIITAARQGSPSEQRLEVFGPPTRVFVLRGIPLPSGGALAIVEDVTDRWRLDQVRTDFVANISHELKTPVGGLAVLADALAGVDDIAVVEQLAARMVEEAQRAARTIDDLLELSQIELGGEAGDEEVDLGEVVGEAVARVRTLAGASGVRLAVADGGVEVVRGDRRQLASAVANLIDNAVKYSDEGGTVWIDVDRVDGWVDVTVRDEGIGIPARDLDRVFERFYRVDRARRRATGGTGLGLAIVRHVANNHGGEVSVSSTEGVGTSFTLRLPAERRS